MLAALTFLIVCTWIPGLSPGAALHSAPRVWFVFFGFVLKIELGASVLPLSHTHKTEKRLPSA